MQDSHPLGKYLIVLDECVHPAKSSLERREPIGGLFRDIEKHLHTIRDPSPFFWGRRTVSGLAMLQGIESTHFGSDSNYLLRLRGSPEVAFETGTFAVAMEWGIGGCPQKYRVQQPQVDTATVLIAGGVKP